MAIKKSQVISKFQTMKGNTKGVVASIIDWCVEVIVGFPEEDYSETIEQLERIRGNYESLQRTWPGFADDNPWSKDVKALNVAIEALKREDMK